MNDETHLTGWTLYNGGGAISYDHVPTLTTKMEGREYRPESWIIVCQHCGEVWARRLSFTNPRTHWQVKRWPCESCGYGSLWDAWNPAWNSSLPPQLLHRELRIIENWYNQGIRTYRAFWENKFFRRKV